MSCELWVTIVTFLLVLLGVYTQGSHATSKGSSIQVNNIPSQYFYGVYSPQYPKPIPRQSVVSTQTYFNLTSVRGNPLSTTAAQWGFLPMISGTATAMSLSDMNTLGPRDCALIVGCSTIFTVITYTESSSTATAATPFLKTTGLGPVSTRRTESTGATPTTIPRVITSTSTSTTSDLPKTTSTIISIFAGNTTKNVPALTTNTPAFTTNTPTSTLKPTGPTSTIISNPTKPTKVIKITTVSIGTSALSTITLMPTLTGTPHSHTSIIVGGVVGGIAGLAIIVAALILIVCRRSKATIYQESDPLSDSLTQEMPQLLSMAHYANDSGLDPPISLFSRPSSRPSSTVPSYRTEYGNGLARAAETDPTNHPPNQPSLQSYATMLLRRTETASMIESGALNESLTQAIPQAPSARIPHGPRFTGVAGIGTLYRPDIQPVPQSSTTMYQTRPGVIAQPSPSYPSVQHSPGPLLAVPSYRPALDDMSTKTPESDLPRYSFTPPPPQPFLAVPSYRTGAANDEPNPINNPRIPSFTPSTLRSIFT